MKVALSALANGASIDRHGRLTVFGVFDHYLTSDFPARLTRVTVALQIVLEGGDRGQHSVEVRWRHGDQLIARLPGPTIEVGQVSGGALERTTRSLFFNLDNLEFDRPGRYVFEVLVGDSVLASEPLIVRKRDDVSGGSTSPGSQGVLQPPGGPLQA